MKKNKSIKRGKIGKALSQKMDMKGQVKVDGMIKLEEVILCERHKWIPTDQYNEVICSVCGAIDFLDF